MGWLCVCVLGPNLNVFLCSQVSYAKETLILKTPPDLIKLVSKGKERERMKISLRLLSIITSYMTDGFLWAGDVLYLSSDWKCFSLLS